MEVASVDWKAIAAIVSAVMSSLALGLSILSYRRTEALRRRAELRGFLEETAYAADRLIDQLAAGAASMDAEALLPEIDRLYAERLLPLLSKATAWPGDPLVQSFHTLVAAAEKARGAMRECVESDKDFSWKQEAGLLDDRAMSRQREAYESWGATRLEADHLATMYGDEARDRLRALKSS